MKYLITERQLKLIKEDNIRKIDFDIFNNDWALLQKFLERRGNPPYIIRGNVDLTEISIKSLGNLVGVIGNLNLGNNKTLEDLGSLEFVENILYLHNTNIKSLGSIKYVGGDLILRNSDAESLGNLESVGGYFNLKNSYINSLGNLKSVGGNFDARTYRLKSLGKLETVGGYLFIDDTNIDSLGNLKYVGAEIDLKYTPLARKITEDEIRSQVEVGGYIDL